jgi:predicted thioredoxin/glutaredoxin
VAVMAISERGNCAHPGVAVFVRRAIRHALLDPLVRLRLVGAAQVLTRDFTQVLDRSAFSLIVSAAIAVLCCHL